MYNLWGKGTIDYYYYYYDTKCFIFFIKPEHYLLNKFLYINHLKLAVKKY